MNRDDDWQDDDGDEYISKSHFKREAEALQNLGEELVALTPAQLAKVPLDDALLASIELAQRLANKREAKRRQLQYIGKLMRSRDPEPIRRALDRIKQRTIEANARFARLERLRDQLVDGGDAALSNAFELYPDADRQQLRTLVRQSHKKDGSIDTTAARALFRYLRTLDEQQLAAADETAEMNDWADAANATGDENP